MDCTLSLMSDNINVCAVTSFHIPTSKVACFDVMWLVRLLLRHSGCINHLTARIICCRRDWQQQANPLGMLFAARYDFSLFYLSPALAARYDFSLFHHLSPSSSSSDFEKE